MSGICTTGLTFIGQYTNVLNLVGDAVM